MSDATTSPPRTTVISAGVRPGERDLIVAAAAVEGLTLSTFVRRAAVAAARAALGIDEGEAKG